MYSLYLFTLYVYFHFFHIVLVLSGRGNFVSIPKLTLSPNTIDMRTKQTINFSCEVVLKYEPARFYSLSLSRQNQNHTTPFDCQVKWSQHQFNATNIHLSDYCNDFHYEVCHTGRLIRVKFLSSSFALSGLP